MKLSLRPIKTDLHFFLINLMGKMKSSILTKRLIEKYGILVRDCSSIPGLSNDYIRISIRSMSENNELIRALEHEINNSNS